MVSYLVRIPRFLGRQFVALIRKIPLLGHVTVCSPKELLSSARDFGITLAFSTITFWFSAVIMSVLNSNRDIGYSHLLWSTIQGGELFIFSVGVLGPILITVMDESRPLKAFPSGLWLMFFLAFVALICGGLFALSKTTSAELLNRGLLVTLSLWAACFSCVLRYLTIAYSKSLSRLGPDYFFQGEKTYTDSFNSRHGGNK